MSAELCRDIAAGHRARLGRSVMGGTLWSTRWCSLPWTSSPQTRVGFRITWRASTIPQGWVPSTVSDSAGLGWAWECTFLTSSQKMLMLLFVIQTLRNIVLGQGFSTPNAQEITRETFKMISAQRYLFNWLAGGSRKLHFRNCPQVILIDS